MSRANTNQDDAPDAYHRFDTGGGGGGGGGGNESVRHTPASSEAAVDEGQGGEGREEMRKRLQQEARFAANRVFR